MRAEDPWDDDTPGATDSGGGAETTEEPRLFYASVDEFVGEFLIHAYRRRINGRDRVWATEWWRHEEAIMRLEALWRAWEHLRLEPALGMSVWWRDHADPHMTALMSPDGPFGGEGASDPRNINRAGEPLPFSSPPAAMLMSARPLEPKE